MLGDHAEFEIRVKLTLHDVPEHSIGFMRLPGIRLDQSTHTNMIITSPEDLTPEWMTDMLRRNGINARVIRVDVILRKELPISTVCRLAVHYDGPGAEGRPRTLFVKLPRGSGEANDHTEVEFYRDIAADIPGPPLVRCYDAAYSSKTGRSHIVLDDLFDTHSQPKSGIPPSVELSRLAVEALAKAHAATWGRRIEDLGSGNSDIRGSGFTTPSVAGFDLQKFIEDLDKSVHQFLKVAELTGAQKLAYRRMLATATAIWGRVKRSEHVTVTHGDTHWWNFLYPIDPSIHSVHIIDWHLWHIDLGARDLAFLLALGGFAEPRPDLENELLRVYHDTLAVDGYSWDMLIEDYRWSAIRNLNIPVIFWSQGKHYSTWQTALRRAWEAYERLKCRTLIS